RTRGSPFFGCQPPWMQMVSRFIADFFLFGISEENQMMVDSKGYGVECKRFEESPENGKIRKRKTMP
ncbi:hypothetical protein ABTK14_21055, partial [Acinetobacter baumannii]